MSQVAYKANVEASGNICEGAILPENPNRWSEDVSNPMVEFLKSLDGAQLKMFRSEVRNPALYEIMAKTLPVRKYTKMVAAQKEIKEIRGNENDEEFENYCLTIVGNDNGTKLGADETKVQMEELLEYGKLKEHFLKSLSDEQIGLFCKVQYDADCDDKLEDILTYKQYQLYMKAQIEDSIYDYNLWCKPESEALCGDAGSEDRLVPKDSDSCAQTTENDNLNRIFVTAFQPIVKQLQTMGNTDCEVVMRVYSDTNKKESYTVATLINSTYSLLDVQCLPAEKFTIFLDELGRLVKKGARTQCTHSAAEFFRIQLEFTVGGRTDLCRFELHHLQTLATLLDYLNYINLSEAIFLKIVRKFIEGLEIIPKIVNYTMKGTMSLSGYMFIIFKNILSRLIVSSQSKSIPPCIVAMFCPDDEHQNYTVVEFGKSADSQLFDDQNFNALYCVLESMITEAKRFDLPHKPTIQMEITTGDEEVTFRFGLEELEKGGLLLEYLHNTGRSTTEKVEKVVTMFQNSIEMYNII